MLVWTIIYSACQSLPEDIRSTGSAHLQQNHPLQCNAVPISLCCSFPPTASRGVLARRVGQIDTPVYCLLCLLLFLIVRFREPVWKRASHCCSSAAVPLSSSSSTVASSPLCCLELLRSIASTSDLAEICIRQARGYSQLLAMLLPGAQSN